MPTGHKEIVIVGSGPTGLVCAALLAQEGWSITLIAPQTNNADLRTVALLQPSLKLLQYVGAWTENLKYAAAPLRHLHIIDDTQSYSAAQELCFSAAEVDQSEFGYAMPVSALNHALQHACQRNAVTFKHASVVAVEPGPSEATVTCDDGSQLNPSAVIGADGANSLVRKSVGITTTDQSATHQSVCIGTIMHSASHNDSSFEFHRSGGLFTTVPAKSGVSTFLYMDREVQINRLSSWSIEELRIEWQLMTHGKLGCIKSIEIANTIPIRALRANKMSARRTFLIGEAAHLTPPIGAQGLNTSFQDAAVLNDILAGADDPGCELLTSAFDKQRSEAITFKHQFVSHFSASLVQESLIVSLFRAGSLTALNLAPPLRSFVMNTGMGTAGNQPFTMR